MRVDALSFSLLLALTACVPGTGRDIVDVGLEAIGQSPEPFDIGGFTITLDRAQLAIGPLYLCATEAGELDLCDPAHFERIEPFIVDALDPEVQRFGTMTGTSGSVRTAFFDFGISWYPTASTPRPGPEALLGHSAIFEGMAVRGADMVRFVFFVDVVPVSRGAMAVLGSPSVADVAGGETLRVSVDARGFLASVDFEDLLDEVVDPDEPVVITRGDHAHSAVVLQMTALAPPIFAWHVP